MPLGRAGEGKQRTGGGLAYQPHRAQRQRGTQGFFVAVTVVQTRYALVRGVVVRGV